MYFKFIWTVIWFNVDFFFTILQLHLLIISDDVYHNNNNNSNKIQFVPSKSVYLYRLHRQNKNVHKYLNVLKYIQINFHWQHLYIYIITIDIVYINLKISKRLCRNIIKISIKFDYHIYMYNNKEIFNGFLYVCLSNQFKM